MIANRGVSNTLALHRTLYAIRHHAITPHQVRSLTTSSSVQPVYELHGPTKSDSLKHDIWSSTRPIVIRNAHSLSAMSKWFSGTHDKEHKPFTEYFRRFDTVLVPYEFTSQPHQSSTWTSFFKWSATDDPGHIMQPLLSSQDGASHFHQFFAPLGLLQQASEYNLSRLGEEQLTHLYVAQSDIRDLPETLQGDLEAPDIVKQSPRGDIYSSSIWMGLQPTYTPLHTDPNPNIFCQLRGLKTVRFVAPKVGMSIFNRIQRTLGMQGNPKLRGTEMMEGPERDMLHETVWSIKAGTDQLQEATVAPGDALFIPKGWWHSFVSKGDVGEVNASANWWCR